MKSLILSILIFAGLITLPKAYSSTSNNKKPNIIFLMADDMDMEIYNLITQSPKSIHPTWLVWQKRGGVSQTHILQQQYVSLHDTD